MGEGWFARLEIPFGSGKQMDEPSLEADLGLDEQESPTSVVKRKGKVMFKTKPVSKTAAASWCPILITLHLTHSHSIVADCLLQVEARQESGGLGPSAWCGKEWIQGAVLGARVRSRSSSCREGKGAYLSTSWSAATMHPPYALSPALPVLQGGRSAVHLIAEHGHVQLMKDLLTKELPEIAEVLQEGLCFKEQLERDKTHQNMVTLKLGKYVKNKSKVQIGYMQKHAE